MDPSLPDYGGPNLGRVVPALLGAVPAPWLPSAVAGADSVVLLVLDGLGWSALDAHGARLPVLRGLDGGPATTVIPSTTASALTSLTTGLPPAEHGVVGFRMRIDAGVLNVLRWRREDGRHAPDPFAVQRHAAFAGREVPVVTKSEFASTGFTGAHLRGARFVGWSTTSVLVEHCRRLVAAGERLVYAYYPGVDAVAHEYGLEDAYYRDELAFADDLVGRLLEALPARAAVVVTADHGQVHLGADGWIGLGPLDGLVEAYAGDGRFRYLHAHRGAATELTAAAHELVGGPAWVLTREQLVDERWLGPNPPGASVRRRLGDVVLAAREPVAFTDPTLVRETHLLAAHGSCTADEMTVPLLAARGRA